MIVIIAVSAKTLIKDGFAPSSLTDITYLLAHKTMQIRFHSHSPFSLFYFIDFCFSLSLCCLPFSSFRLICKSHTVIYISIMTPFSSFAMNIFNIILILVIILHPASSTSIIDDKDTFIVNVTTNDYQSTKVMS